MRINEYHSLNQFIYEYESGPAPSLDDEHPRKYMGIEFKYHGQYYRMCREPLSDDERPKLSDGRLGFYEVSLMHCEKESYPGCDYFESLGWYSDIYDLLENCYIDGHPFKDVIMADETQIMSQD